MNKHFSLIKKNLYKSFSGVFLFLSLIGSLYLVGQNQDNRNRATHIPPYGCTAGNLGTMCQCDGGQIGQVYRETDCSVKCGDCGRFTGSCQSGKTGGVCNCGDEKSGEMYQDSTCSSKCICDDAPVPSNYLPKSPNPSVSYMTGCNGINVAQVGGCLVSTGQGTIKVSSYTCPDQYNLTTGCNENGVIYETNAICLKNDFCGTQQMDVWGGKSGSCGIDVVIPCSITGGEEKTSTPTPTGTIAPTSTSTTTPTPTPTSAPTSTLKPTSTPKDFREIAKEPSPTRITLPTAGVEFPSQALTIVGAIVTLLGILVLL